MELSTNAVSVSWREYGLSISSGCGCPSLALLILLFKVITITITAAATFLDHCCVSSIRFDELTSMSKGWLMTKYTPITRVFVTWIQCPQQGPALDSDKLFPATSFINTIPHCFLFHKNQGQ
jgi:hypothetical protein